MKKAEEQENLLEEELDFSLQMREAQNMSSKIRWRTNHLIASHLINVALVLTLLWYLTHIRTSDPQLGIYSPLNDEVEYEDVIFYDNIQHFSPYQLAPNDTIDKMWSDLYNHAGTTRIQAESALLLPNKTVVIPGTEGDGLVMFEIFHVLHCVNSLRKSLWPERYPAQSVFNEDGSRNEDLTKHHMHCIDRIRQNLQCAGNIGTMTWRWQEETNPPYWRQNMEVTYKCRKFDRLLDWAVQNEYIGWDTSIPSNLTP